MELESNYQRVLLVGALIGAVLGAGIAYALMVIPKEREEEEEVVPVTANDLLNLTKTAAGLIRGVDDVRRKL